MNYYGTAVLEHLTAPRTLRELMDLTGFQARYILDGIRQARMDGHVVRALPGPVSTDGFDTTAEPTLYVLEGRNDHDA